MNQRYESLQQKVVRAAWELDAGTPLKDSLTEYQIHEAILMLADVLTTLGVTVLEE